MSGVINHWWVTRPKRKLDSVHLILTNVVYSFLNEKWSGHRGSHLAFEKALEDANLKRAGTRRDQTGGGARTYIAWLKSLGLLFEDSEHNLNLTLAGDQLFHDANPVEILKNQVIKYQFPSTLTSRQSFTSTA